MYDADLAEWDRRAIDALINRIAHARKKHPNYAADAQAAYHVIVDEVLELKHAIGNNVEHESRERQIDEALDVAATCIRFIVGEHLGHAR